MTDNLNGMESSTCIRNDADNFLNKEGLSKLGKAFRNLFKKKTTPKERQIVETVLKDSFELNRLVMKAIPFGMEVIDESGTILFQSETMKKMSGGEGIGKKCWTVNRDDGSQCTDCPLRYGITEGATESNESSGLFGEKTFEIVHTGMTYLGNKAILEIFIDKTLEKEMRDKIIKSESHYRALTDLSPDGILITDLEGKVMYVSNKVYQIFGIPEGRNLIGESVLKWVDPEDHYSVIKRISDLISGRSMPEVREYRLLKNDGTSFLGELSSTSLPGSDDFPESLLVVCRDVTERQRIANELIKAKEKAEEGDRLKTAFLQNISHEIRTPLNAIVGFSLLLGEDDIDTKTRNSYIEIITESSNHLLAILNDIIDMSSFEAGAIKIYKEQVNVNAILKNLHRRFRIEAEKKQISFTYYLDLADEHSGLTTDGTRIQQILSNLIENALKFTKRGTVKFGYHLKGDWIEFYVYDTGLGISKEDQKKIFNRFCQIEDPSTKQFRGLGLGLSIAKAFTELLGGQLKLVSEPGEGSVFYLTIPFERPVKENDSPVIQAKGKMYAFRERKKILVAEDTDSNFMLLKHYLSGLNAEVVHASDGNEAVEMALKHAEFDLVLMDVKMPVMDGFTATRKIKEKRPDIPVVIQTAYVSDMAKAIECGCDGFLTKPYDSYKLENIIMKLI